MANLRLREGEINPSTGKPVGEASRQKYAEMKGETYAPAASGSAGSFNKAYGQGGYSADDMEQYVNAYIKANNDGHSWTNGYSSDANHRAGIANPIRQQMDANSKAWHDADEATRTSLHEQNVALAALLPKYTSGGGRSEYNAALGRWETDDGNLGYGYNRAAVFDPAWKQQVYGQTPEQMQAYANDTDRYYNLVSQNGKRNWVDESEGYTGVYRQFLNGPNALLMMQPATGLVNRANYVDLIGDGFDDEAYWTPTRDADGNIVAVKEPLKPNSMTDYTKNKAAYIDDMGIMRPGVLNGTTAKTASQNMWLNGGIAVEDPGENYGVSWRTKENPLKLYGSSADKTLAELGYGGDGTGGSYEDYINKYYDAAIASEMAALDQGYEQSLAQLEANSLLSALQYDEARRAAAGQAEQNAAAMREMANAQGTSSGTLGQTLASNIGQTQAQMGAMAAAQAQAQGDVEAQRALLAQTYRQQIAQAEADNDYARAQALLAEAQRVDEALRAQQQQMAAADQSYMQLLMGG